MPILTLTATGSNVAPSPFYLSVPFFIFFHARFDTTVFNIQKYCNAQVIIFSLLISLVVVIVIVSVGDFSLS